MRAATRRAVRTLEKWIVWVRRNTDDETLTLLTMLQGANVSWGKLGERRAVVAELHPRDGDRNEGQANPSPRDKATAACHHTACALLKRARAFPWSAGVSKLTDWQPVPGNSGAVSGRFLCPS